MNLNLEEFQCSVCLNQFGKGLRCPRVLQCGHSFCTTCLQKIVKDKPQCPTCMKAIQVIDVNLMPINYLIKSLVEREASVLKASKPSPTSPKSHLQYKGICRVHKNYRQMKCMTCNKFICGACTVMYHSGPECKVSMLSKINQAIEAVKHKHLARLEKIISYNRHMITVFYERSNKVKEEKDKSETEIVEHLKLMKTSRRNFRFLADILQNLNARKQLLDNEFTRYHDWISRRSIYDSNLKDFRTSIYGATTMQDLSKRLGEAVNCVRKMRSHSMKSYTVYCKYTENQDGILANGLYA